jgi:hypothetical protein
MKVKDHMQAFPFIEPHEDDAVKAYHPGISLRDYFAAKAMQALLPIWRSDLEDELNIINNEGGTPTSISEEAYAMADAMLKARQAC